MSCKDNRSSNNYVSFADGKGGWGQPVYLSPGFNSGNDEYGAHLSLDGNYLFFTRHRKAGNTIYWVAASAILKLKPWPGSTLARSTRRSRLSIPSRPRPTPPPLRSRSGSSRS